MTVSRGSRPEGEARYVIEGKPRSGKNSTQMVWSVKRRRMIVVKSDAAAEWQQGAIAQLVSQRGRKRTLRGPVYVEYVVYQAADVADIDNLEAALFDALKKAKVIEDDKLIVDHRGRKDIDREWPRFEVLVRAA